MGGARVEVAVVGGGVAGLAAAYELHRRGADFRLLEASDRWGGVVRTESADGFLMEGGPDALLAQKPAAMELCRDLGLADRVVSTNPEHRTIFVRHGGRLHRLPDGMVLGVPTRLAPLAATGLFTWPAKLRMAADLVLPPRPAAGDESIASFFRRRLGAQALERLGAPFLAGIHAGDAERLSIRATFPRLVEMESRHGSLIRALAAARGRDRANAGPPFFSLRGGLSELVDALVAALPPHRLGSEAPVRELHRTGDGYRLQLDGREEIAARAVVLALPAPRAAPLLSPLDREAADLLAGIPFASSAVVCLGYRRADVGHPLDGYGLVVAETEGLRTTACGFFSTKFPGRAPAGHVLLRGFVGGARDPGAARLSDAELADTVHREMAPTLALAAPPVLVRAFRWPEATPQMLVGHLERVALLERRLATHAGLRVTGAGLRGTGIPDTVGDARRTAAGALDWIRAGDIPSPAYTEAGGPAKSR